MAQLLTTYSYTCNIVRTRFSPAKQLATNFPAAFFVAYQNWYQASRGFTLKEVCQELLQRESSGCFDLNNAVFLHSSYSPPPGEPTPAFCLLSTADSSQQIVRRLYFSANCPKYSILLSPSCLQNISNCWSQTEESVRTSKFLFHLCDHNYSPPTASEATVRAVDTALLRSVPLHVMDDILAQYFASDRLLFENSFLCIDLTQYLTSTTVEIFPLLRQQPSSVYFYVESLTSDQTEEGEEHQTGGLIVKKSQSKLAQCSNIRIPAPTESVLSNFNINIKKTPEFFQKHLDTFALTFRRYKKSLQKFPSKSCLKFVFSGNVGSGQDVMTGALAKYLGLEYATFAGRDLIGDTSGSSEALVRRFGSSLSNTHHSVIVIEEVDVVAFNKDGQFDERAFLALQETLEEVNNTNILVGVCQDLNKLQPRLAALFLHHHEVPGLSQGERRDLLTWLLLKHRLILEGGVELDHWAELTTGFNLSDLENLLDSASDEAGPGSALTESALTEGLTVLQRARSDRLGLAKVPSVSWEEVGGLEEARQEVLEAVRSAGGELRRCGVLLYGPPGVGKTLLAKAVASQSRQSFISVKGPELLNMYVGQSEENVRQVFARARQAQPCIVFFDELDSLAPNRGKTGDGGGVMDRVVSALLTELDRLQSSRVTIIAATNRPDLVDPALLRPGRCDRLVYLGASRDSEQKLNILRALTGKINRAEDCDLASLSLLLPQGLTGADISSLVSEAAMAAIRRAVAQIEQGREDVEAAEVSYQDFLEALENVVPSVSPAEMRNYELLRENLRK